MPTIHLRTLPALIAAALLAACAAGGGTTGAGADTAGPVSQGTQYPATSVRSDGQTDMDEDGECEAPTGSRIRSRAPDCKSTSGATVRTYGKEDLRGTGQTDPGKALQQIDPAITR